MQFAKLLKISIGPKNDAYINKHKKYRDIKFINKKKMQIVTIETCALNKEFQYFIYVKHANSIHYKANL